MCNSFKYVKSDEIFYPNVDTLKWTSSTIKEHPSPELNRYKNTGIESKRKLKFEKK